jgi:hypothetical protein
VVFFAYVRTKSEQPNRPTRRWTITRAAGGYPSWPHGIARAWLFDLDDTLISDAPAITAGYEAVAERDGPPRSASLSQFPVTEAEPGSRSRCHPGRAKSTTTRISPVACSRGHAFGSRREPREIDVELSHTRD